MGGGHTLQVAVIRDECELVIICVATFKGRLVVLY